MNPITMMLDGWCDDCDQDPTLCFEKGHCVIDEVIENKIKEEENGKEESV